MSHDRFLKVCLLSSLRSKLKLFCPIIGIDKKDTSDQTVLLPKWCTHRGIILAKGQLCHSFTFWTMSIMIFSLVSNSSNHPLLTCNIWFIQPSFTRSKWNMDLKIMVKSSMEIQLWNSSMKSVQKLFLAIWFTS